jgi:hypothetical protein
MGEGVGGLYGEDLVEGGGGFVGTALLEERVSLGYVGPQERKAEDEEESKGKTDSRRMYLDDHG